MKELRFPFSFLCSLFSVLLLLAAPSVRAQQPWNFSSVSQASRAEAYLVQPPASIRQALPNSLIYNTVYHLSGPIRHRGQPSIRLQSPPTSPDSVDLYIQLHLADSLLPYLVSTHYWHQRFLNLLQWTYIDTNIAAGILLFDTTTSSPYSTLHWLGYSFQPSEQWPVLFTVATNSGSPQTLTLPALDQLARWGAFATTQDHLNTIRHQQALVDTSLQLDRHLSALDSQLNSQTALIDSFIDSLAQALSSDSIDRQRRSQQAQVQRTTARMDKDQIFLFSIKHARSDYMFGLEYNFYNCFDKTISKIEITIVPYNDRGQPQPDKFNRTARTVRCMGPIPPHAPAQYRFDELFWNDRGRIKYMRTTSVTFHFSDGSSRSFNGYNKILRHTL